MLAIRFSLLTGELARPARVLGLDIDRVWTVLEHRAPPIEEDTWVHHDARRRDIPLDVGSGSQLDNAKRPDTPEYLTEHLGRLDLDVCSHDSVLADLKTIAVEHVPLELALDPKGSNDHQCSSEGRAHS